MKKLIIIICSLLILFSCNNPQENKTTDKASTQDTLASLHVTVIANLHDSLQPKTIALDSMPKPLMVAVPNQTGGFYTKTNAKGVVTKINLEPPVIRALAVLQNEKGEPILDTDGKPFIKGDGGKSNFTNFTTENGLALDGISCSIMDKMGNLWIGTSGGGVSRYDGKSFVTFSTAQGLANNMVLSLVEDKMGNLWFGTYGGGVSRYDGKSFVTFSTAQGLASNDVKSIAQDKTGNLWFGTLGDGVSRYDGKTFTTFSTAHGLANNMVLSMVEDKTGNLWFGTYGGGVSRYEGKSFVTFSTAQGLANNTVLSIAEDKTGNLWFGTEGGVSRYDPSAMLKTGSKSFVTFTTAQGLAINTVFSIAEDKTGNLWFGTNGGGVSRYDGKTFTTFSTVQGLATNTVWSIAEDKTGNLWFSTNAGGLSRYDGKSFVTFTTVQGLTNNTVFSIAEDKTGNLWFGTYGGGVSRYDGKSFVTYTTAQGLANNTVYSIAEDKTGNLWFGTERGVSRYDPSASLRIGSKSFITFTTAQGLANGNVTSIAEDKMGNLWFGTEGGGVSSYDGKSFVTFTTAQGLANGNVTSIAEDNTGNLWFGTEGGGVSRYDGKSFVTFTTAHGLASNTVNCITEDRTGNLWFGTEKGLSVMSAAESKMIKEKNDKVRVKITNSAHIFKTFTKMDGIPDNSVTQILQMPNGKMAVGTNLGITLLNLSDNFTKLKDIEIYNSNTGYPVKDVLAGQNSMLLDSKGIIWAGTGSEKTGLVRFDYAALQKNTEPPALVIQSIKVKDENICWYNLQSKGVRKNYEDSAAALLQEFLAYGKTLSSSENDSILKKFGSLQFDGTSKFYPLPQNLVLPYEHNKISFEFAAIETGKPFLVKYQYMLEGYDKDWSPVTDKSNATYGNINEGTYTFKLKSQGANGVWCKPITYTFKVLPPWYRSWWSYTIYLLLLLLSFRVYVKWRERNLRMEKEKLEHTVEIRTAELIAEKKEVERQKQEADTQRDEANKQRERSDELLLNILPEEVAEELKAKGSADAKQFDEVTVMFTDFKGFTQISEKLSPAELVAEIHTCFKAFDNIITRYNIEKIKTIGDAYMCAGGLPVTNTTNAVDVVQAAMEIQQFMQQHLQQRKDENKEPFEIRIGIHTGPVVAGIVGIKKFAYDIWGDTVNTSSRMESSGEAGKINISGSTFELVKDKFKCLHRGKIEAKGKGEMDMYFVDGRVC